MNWWEQPIWALDLETTSADPLDAEIVSWAVVKLAPSGRVLEHHGGICRTDAWSAGAESVHGIPRAESALGMIAEAAREELNGILRRVRWEAAPLVVFNASYDLTILDGLGLGGLAAGQRVIDPLVIDRALDKYRRGGRRLNLVCKHFGIELTDAHDAMADAVAAGQLAFLLPLAYEGARAPLAELHERQVEWAREWAAGLQTHKRKTTPTAVVDGSWPVRRQAVAS